jgi:16S rRNA (adenine1518-N6/adenine1519-N6)-dimethyltransferase
MSAQRRSNVASARPGKKPKLGQNFLADRSYAARIVEALGDVSARTVIEIGPGRGVLTQLLVSRTPRLIAIELDRVLAAQLRMNFARQKNAEIVEADVLTVEFDSLLRRRPEAWALHARHAEFETADVVGNLPYYITSDILLRLFQYHELFGTIVIMVQKEVAGRIAAAPGSRDYGLLSATTQLYTKVEALFTVPPGAFSPPPKVYSAVLRLAVSPRMKELGVEAPAFIEFLKLAFAQKRKTLLNNLKRQYGQNEVRGTLQRARLRADVRAEAISLEKAAAVFKLLNMSSRGAG